MTPRIATLFLAALCSWIALSSFELRPGEDRRAGSPVELEAAKNGEGLRAGFERHCFSCHGEAETNGGVDLARLGLPDGEESSWTRSLAADPELVEKLIGVLEFEEMPPDTEERPSESVRSAWIDSLNAMLGDAMHREEDASPRRRSIRRMNRFEYGNAVRDLFELEVNVFSLPEAMVRARSDYFQPDSGRMPKEVVVGNRALGKSQLIEDRLHGVNPFPQDLRAEHGFNNRGDHLSLSPVLLESFLALAQSIVDAENFPSTCGIWTEFFVAPDPEEGPVRAVARERLRRFLRRAFRGHVPTELLDRYMERFDALTESGSTFEESMRALASVALVSPRFLYIYEPEQATGRISDLDLASRLSFYLWSSIPDEPLLDLAERGELSKRDVLDEQVQRMTRHPRIKNFCDSFPAQWLALDALVGARPDRERYPDYYFAGMGKFVIGIHMQLEPLLLFEAWLIEDRPAERLLDPWFTYRTPLLDAWYAGKDVEELEKPPNVLTFRRKKNTDRRYGGVLTNAAVLTMTSAPLRTQPITRGAWVRSVIFNDPPEPPPGMVPSLAEDDEVIEAAGTTIRQKLAAHLVRTDCASCHSKIDPFGFALEEYDPLGRWRSEYRSGLPIDSSGSLFGQHDFSDAIEFKDALLEEGDRFVRALAEHLLSYALGRELDFRDRPSIDAIIEKTEAAGGGLRTLVEQVALSSALVGGPFPGAESPREDG